MLMPWKLECLL